MPKLLCGQIRTAGPGFTLYPGERAEAVVTEDDLLRAMTGESVELTEYLIVPAPGWRAWWLRARFRLRWRLGLAGAREIEP